MNDKNNMLYKLSYLFDVSNTDNLSCQETPSESIKDN